MVRWLGGVLSGLLGVLTALVVAAGAAPRRYVERGGLIEGAAVRAAMAAEGAEATRRGMALAAQGDATLTIHGSTGVWSMPLAFGANECVAVVVGVEGRQRVTRAAIQVSARTEDQISDDAMAQAGNGGGLVAQVQWCERSAATRRLVVTSDAVASGSERSAQNTLRWAVHRGPWRTVGGPVRLTRGSLRAEALEGLGDDLAATEARALFPNGVEAVGEAMPATLGFARLIPSDGVTYTALLRASTRGGDRRANPRVDPSTTPGVRWATGLPLDFGDLRARSGTDLSVPVHDPVVDLGLNDFRRVLAVVDRARLGAPCAGVVLSRQRYAFAARAEALDADGTVRQLGHRENVAVDDRCPVSGPTIYLAPSDDHDVWQVQIVRAAQ
jgi:hypothetical protein